MSFVTLGGDGSSRPSLFELVAAERLMPSLKAAVAYSLSLYALRRPGLNRLLDNEEELFFLISVLLDRQGLRGASPASFAEGVYGLQRVPFGMAAPPATASADAGGGGGAAAAAERELSCTQRSMSLILLTLVPYLRAKLDATYRRLEQQQQQGAGLLGLALAQRQQQEQEPRRAGAGVASGAAGGARERLRAAALRAFLQGYPWVHAAYEGARFAYQLLYLLDASPYYSPELHLLGAVVARVSGGALAQAQAAQAGRRAARLAAAGGGPLGAARRAWLRAGHLVADHTRSALILAVFAFKLLEWWYTSAEQKLGGRQALPPPPPPPVPPPAADGLPLPADAAACPLCARRRTNPAMVATSGYVFCYPCAYRWVADKGCCPVTRIPAGLEHVRRLYQGT